MKLSEFGEFGLIERLSSIFKDALPKGLIGIGDDAAVIPSSELCGSDNCSLLMTTDLMVEDRHFRLSNFSPYSLGWKLLAVNISDIAAMGGEPLYALITLQLKDGVSVEWVEELYRGIKTLADCQNVKIIGGDTVLAREISLGITLIGRGVKTPILRSGARVGDLVWISGDLGSSNLGFRTTEGELFKNLSDKEIDEAKQRFFEPIPCTQLARFISNSNLASSMIDISDGLIQDASHIAKQSNVTIELELAAIPCLRAFPDKRHALIGGEDYQLLFTVQDKNSSMIQRWGNGQERSGAVSTPSKIGRVLARQGEALIQIKLPDNNRIVSAEEYLTSIGIKDKRGFTHF